MPNIPTEQWAQVIEKTGGPVDYKKIPVQKPGPDEVLVNIKFSGVCHTDLHAVNGDWPLVSLFSSSHLEQLLTTSSPPSYPSSVATKVPVKSLPLVTSSLMSRSAILLVSSG